MNIVYGLMMREMNDYVARRALFTTTSPAQATTSLDITNSTGSTSNSATSQWSPAVLVGNMSHKEYQFNQQLQNNFTMPLNFNGTFQDAQEIFINNSYNLCMFVILFGVTRFVALYMALLFFSRAATNQAKRVKALFFRSLLCQESRLV